MAELGVGAFANGRAQPLTKAFLGMLELLWESKFEHSRMAELDHSLLWENLLLSQKLSLLPPDPF